MHRGQSPPQACRHSRPKHLSRPWRVTMGRADSQFHGWGLYIVSKTLHPSMQSGRRIDWAVLIDDDDAEPRPSKLVHEAHRWHGLMGDLRLRQQIPVGQCCARAESLLQPACDLRIHMLLAHMPIHAQLAPPLITIHLSQVQLGFTPCRMCERHPFALQRQCPTGLAWSAVIRRSSAASCVRCTSSGWLEPTNTKPRRVRLGQLHVIEVFAPGLRTTGSLLFPPPAV